MFYLLSVVAAPNAQVESMALPAKAVSSQVHNSASILDMFFQADTVVKCVIFILLFFSVVSWTIIIDKSFYFSKINRLHKRFQSDFWSGQSLEVLFKHTVQSQQKHPMALVFISVMQEMRSQSGSQNQFLHERLLQSMRVSVSRSIEELESGIGFLATTANSSPFIGLFGTVWGIMNSFQAIATMNKGVTLAVVAPGIAEALFATAIGLIAAIPAAIFYNKLSSDLNQMSNKVENFAIELQSLIMRDL